MKTNLRNVFCIVLVALMVASPFVCIGMGIDSVLATESSVQDTSDSTVTDAGIIEATTGTSITAVMKEYNNTQGAMIGTDQNGNTKDLTINNGTRARILRAPAGGPGIIDLDTIEDVEITVSIEGGLVVANWSGGSVSADIDDGLRVIGTTSMDTNLVLDGAGDPGEMKIILSGASITTTSADEVENSPVSLTNGAQGRIELIGDNELISESADLAVLEVNSDCSLTLSGHSDQEGNLDVQVDSVEQSNCAAIGGSANSDCGIINITTGANITAIMEVAGNDEMPMGAAIGGSANGNTEGIMIDGGVVTATSQGDGAAIGGGANGYIEEIMIDGGVVTATSQGDGAAIGGGGGEFGDVDDIKIYGGNITATSSEGAGIGGGTESKDFNILINDGSIIATSSKGAGIGGGEEGNAGGITINNGNITATSNGQAAGIGGGDGNDGFNIRINDGNITATSKGDGAGIGSGAGAIGYDIFVNGGDITAISEGNGAGIGGGGDANNIQISGGNIEATSKGNGAGIGSGESSQSDNISISDSYVRAGSGSIERSVGIGGGVGGLGADISIENSYVTLDPQATAYLGVAADYGYIGDAADDLDNPSPVTIEDSSVCFSKDATDSGFFRIGDNLINEDNDSVYRVIVPKVHNLKSTSLNGALNIKQNVSSSAIIKTVPVIASTSNMGHFDLEPDDLSAQIFLPLENYDDINVGAYRYGCVDVQDNSSNATVINKVQWNTKNYTINAPNATDADVGSKLSQSQLNGGSVYFGLHQVNGTFEWSDPDTEITDGKKAYPVTFTPLDLNNYEVLSDNSELTGLAVTPIDNNTDPNQPADPNGPGDPTKPIDPKNPDDPEKTDDPESDIDVTIGDDEIDRDPDENSDDDLSVASLASPYDSSLDYGDGDVKTTPEEKSSSALPILAIGGILLALGAGAVTFVPGINSLALAALSSAASWSRTPFMKRVKVSVHFPEGSEHESIDNEELLIIGSLTATKVIDKFAKKTGMDINFDEKEDILESINNHGAESTDKKWQFSTDSFDTLETDMQKKLERNDHVEWRFL